MVVLQMDEEKKEKQERERTLLHFLFFGRSVAVVVADCEISL